ncbi:MAG: hypothetical protein SGILL_000059 [Bacillariaceae sp.]
MNHNLSQPTTTTTSVTPPPPIDAFSVRSSYSEIPQSTLGESTKTLSLCPYPDSLSREDEEILDGSSQHQALKTNMRIRVVNENSKRFKDLLVKIDDRLPLYGEVYESAAVKKAHVRKWGSKIVQQVKNKQATIRVSVWDDVVESPCYTFTIDELKTTSTRQLYQLVPESDLIKLVLQCVVTDSEESNDTQRTRLGDSQSSLHMQQPYEVPLTGSPLPLVSSLLSKTAISASYQPFTGLSALPEPELAPLSGAESPQKAVKSCSALPSGDIVMPLKKDDASIGSSGSGRKRVKSPRSLYIPQKETEHSPTPSAKSVEKGIFRCPFSGIAVDETIFRDLESQMARHKSHTQLDTLAADYQQAFKKDQQQQQQNEINGIAGHAERRNSGHYYHQTSSSSSNIPPQQQPIPPPASVTSSNHDSSRMSTSEGSILTSESPMSSINLLPKTTMRIRITNEASNRFKDLVVDVKSSLFLYESVYEHQAVKNAHVRKWGTDVVRDVKNKVSEIQCVLLDGTDGEICRTFTVEDLKKTSTKDLLELTPSSDPIRLILKCVKKKASTIDTNSKFSLFLQRGRPQASTRKKSSILTSSKSDSGFGYGLKKPSRPNHMNLSAMKNATFSNKNASFSVTAGTGGKKNSLSNYGSNDSIYKRVGFLDDKSSLASSLGDGSKTILSADDILRRRRTRTGSYHAQDSSMTSLSEGTKTGSIHSTLEDSERTLSATGTLPFANRHQEVGPKPTLKPSPSSESLDPIQLLQKYTKVPQAKSMTNLSSHSDDGRQLRRGRRRSSKTEMVNGAGHETQIKEFMRLCRTKKGREHQSSDNLRGRRSSGTSQNGSRNAIFPVFTPEEVANQQPQSNNFPVSVTNAHQKDQVKDNVEKETISNDSNRKSQMSSAESDRIERFLRFGAQRASISNGSDTSLMSAQNEDGKRSIDDETPKRDDRDGQSAPNMAGVPPIAEIAVFTGGPDLEGGSVSTPGISLSGDVVKEVFPYHIIFDESFRILQVGNSLSLLVDSCSLVGQCVSDIFQITGPIPTFGEWDWLMLEKMKDNTVFLESVAYNSSNQKARIKGTIIEVSKKPRQVMLALFPNVKNLSELEDMNLSMVDLPLHSCQREAVLLGEHSKSEVKLTNHLDQLHRDLINSMEKQIEDRTTELASANQDLEEANNQLARQSARQLEHFACMSHEIRTPLNCIVGMSSLLLEDCEETEMDPMHADSIRMIHTSGELLKAVVDDVLDYAKLESGAFLVDIKPTRLQDALDSVVHSISQKVQEKNIRLRTHYSATLPEMLETDSRRLQQVLFNLLGNAGKFSKNDSVIDLSVKLVHFNGGGGSLDLIRFSVKDYGKGIDSSDFEKIFKPFSQASKETQNVYGGTGLGLSITSKLVKRLGGRISVDSELDKYSEFTVDLPMNPSLVVNVEEVSQRMKNTTIVLVEPMQKYDYSFTSNAIPGEPHPLSEEVSKVYGLSVLRCISLEEACERLEKANTSRQQHYAFLVHENLYCENLETKLSSSIGKDNYTIFTHGPNYMIESTKRRHFKSLSGVFPVALLCTIVDHVAWHQTANDQDESDAAATSSTGLFAALSRPTIEPSTQKTRAVDPDHASLDASARSTVPTPNSSIRSASTDELVSPSGKKLPRKYDLKVLYAEDNLVNQKVLSRVLNRAGITDITIVDDGKKAVDLCETTQFDVIFMDMQMPIMDGMEATRIIIERDPNAKVVFVTAHALDEFKSRADSVGATSFISKPFRVSDIEAVLEKTGICLASTEIIGKEPESSIAGPAKGNAPSFTSPMRQSASEIKPLLMALTDTSKKSTPQQVKPLFDTLSNNKALQEKVKPLFESLQAHEESPSPIFPGENGKTPAVVKPLFPVAPPLSMPTAAETKTPPPPPVGSPTPPKPSPPTGLGRSTSFRTKKEAPPRTLKVLYAEDNLINQKVLSRVLNRTGISDITIVDNGKKAVEITEKTNFDVIFMDMQMPIMDGMEATKHIMERDPESKVVFVTAHALEEYRKQANALGAREFLAKPVKAADIEGVLQKLGL